MLGNKNISILGEGKIARGPGDGTQEVRGRKPRTGGADRNTGQMVCDGQLVNPHPSPSQQTGFSSFTCTSKSSVEPRATAKMSTCPYLGLMPNHSLREKSHFYERKGL